MQILNECSCALFIVIVNARRTGKYNHLKSNGNGRSIGIIWIQECVVLKCVLPHTLFSRISALIVVVTVSLFQAAYHCEDVVRWYFAALSLPKQLSIISFDVAV